jgi:hypothetical protein
MDHADTIGAASAVLHVVRSVAISRTRGFRKNIPSGDEHSRDNRTDDKSVESESRKAAERGYQHNIIGHLGVLAD